MKGLRNRAAVITGVGSGLGRAIGARLAEEGVRVLGIDLDETALAGCDFLADGLALDVGTEEAIGRIAEKAQSMGCDILVPAAGVTGLEMFDAPERTLWNRSLDINLQAVATLCRAMLPLLRMSDQGRIILIGSTCSEFAAAGLSAYVVTKHAILGLARALASELGGQGITVNCVQPGMIATAMTTPAFELFPGLREHWAQKAAVGRIGTPDDIAPLVAFLASREAGFISGHGIYVDGGAMQQNFGGFVADRQR